MNDKKKIYMIGNSHIDPVWFWDWDEGMQEVKATFSAALDRMREYPEVTFTTTSTAFLEWLEVTAPELFAEIRERVKEGRFLLTGGWFIEPDCILPCGEAFIRQGLYGQRYLKETFGIMCRTGSNVDSFGHSPVLPQILKKSGMTEYVFMRPRLDTPLFWWESADGSRVLALSLPSEYTTWFYESTKEAVLMAQEAALQARLHGIPCCFGVGNHGGGPTIQNIKTIYQLKEECPALELTFSGYHEFFDSLTHEEREALPVRREFFDKINSGCYSMDSELKRKNRLAERRLITADMMLCMEQAVTGAGTRQADKDTMKKLWKTLLFNQFHDTLGGTAVKPARDEALMLLSQVCAGSKQIWAASMQNIVNRIDTRGEGFPLFLFNPSGEAYEGPIEAELNWFCKDGLILKDEQGQEVPYQRTYTMAKVRNYNLGGRRAITFWAKLPAAGFLIYRTLIGAPELASDIRKEPEFPLLNNQGNREQDTPYTLENENLRIQFGTDGHLASIYNKKEKYEALADKVTFPIWIDERDTWGGRQDKRFEDSMIRLEFKKLELVESGTVRKQVRAVYVHKGSVLTQLYTLYQEADYLEVKNHLFWDKQWRMLHIAFPLTNHPRQTIAECSGGTFTRQTEDMKEKHSMKEKHFMEEKHSIAEYSMHRFLDVITPGGAGLCIANDGKYTYSLQEGSADITVARSAIYAQGNGKNWYNETEGYEYSDQGAQDFTILLKPHASPLSMKERYRLGYLAEKPYLYLVDNHHSGTGRISSYSLMECPHANIQITAAKYSEDDDGVILRLLETSGSETKSCLKIAGQEYPFTIGGYEILSLKADLINKTIDLVNLLEFSVH